MEVTGNPAKTTINTFSLDIFVNLVDCRETSLPRRAGMVFSEGFHQLMKLQVGHAGQMRGGVTTIHTTTNVLFQQNNFFPSQRQKVSRGGPSDPTSNDSHINGNFVV